jgi:hypothetical protein
VTIAAGLSHPYNVAVNATHIYWTSAFRADAKVLRAPLGGGSPQVLATDPDCHSIVIDETRVYWTDFTSSGSIMTLPLDGGTPVSIMFGQNGPHGLAVDKTHVYWANLYDGNVWKMALSAGTLTGVAHGQVAPIRLAVDANFIYWTNRQTSTGNIMKAPLDDSSGPIEFARDQDEPYNIAVDQTNVYWTLIHGRKIMKQRVDGSGPPVVLASDQGDEPGLAPFGLAVDATHVYWTTFVEGNTAVIGHLRRVPIEGGAWTEIAQTQSYDVALDDTSIYFTRYEDDGADHGAVYRLTPK